MQKTELVLLFLRRLLRIGLIFTAVVASFLMAILASFVLFKNKTYARSYFSNKVAYDKVLASAAFHPLFSGQPFDCSYAVVSLKVGASPLPPATWLGNETWSQTPLPFIPPEYRQVRDTDTTGPITDCVAMGRFSPEVAARLLAAIKEPGSYYLNISSEVELLYSEPQKLAAEVRYGD